MSSRGNGILFCHQGAVEVWEQWTLFKALKWAVLKGLDIFLFFYLSFSMTSLHFLSLLACLIPVMCLHSSLFSFLFASFQICLSRLFHSYLRSSSLILPIHCNSFCLLLLVILLSSPIEILLFCLLN